MKKIILASKSPRRIEMLKKYRENLKIIALEIEEYVDIKDEPQTVVMNLAFEKAYAVSNICDDAIIIAADTVVYLDKVMGKPSSYDEGFAMLKSLSGKIHHVYTGICLIDTVTNKKVVDYEKTEVTFYHLADDEIYRYLNTKEYKDKAGGYGIQGYGELLVKSINGCYNNVKGIPISKVNYLLKKHFSQELF